MEVPCSSILVRCLPALSCFSEQLVWPAHGVLAARPCTRPALGICAVVPGRAAQLSSAFPRLPRVLHSHRHMPKVGLRARAGAAGGAAVAVVAAASPGPRARLVHSTAHATRDIQRFVVPCGGGPLMFPSRLRGPSSPRRGGGGVIRVHRTVNRSVFNG
jgi:hypothetical protein